VAFYNGLPWYIKILASGLNLYSVFLTIQDILL